MNPPTQVLLFAIAFLLTLVFGFWLSRAGKPYNGVLFNLHKLLALLAVVMGAFRIYGILNASQVEAFAVLLMVVAGLGVVALFVTGAFMSAGKSNHARLITIHRIAFGMVLAAVAGTLYLFGGMQA